MGFFTNTRRVIKAGFLNFWRNGAVSFASVAVFTMTLFIFGSLVLGDAVIDASLEQAREQVDITIYFKLDAGAGDIQRLETSLRALPEVESTSFLSRDKVLEEFIETHKNDRLILQSLEELEGENPLRAELNVKAHDPAQYSAIVAYLEGERGVVGIGASDIVDEINFEDNREAIERFDAFITSVEQAAFSLTVVSVIIAVLVAFTTIALAIYISREEISVMRLVGADNAYIQSPFMIEGIMYGVFATFFALAIFYPVTQWATQATNEFFGAIDLFDYYITHFPQMFATLLLSGVVLGIVSSALAIRRHLRV